VNPALPPTAEEPSPLQTGDDSTDKGMKTEEDEEKPELPADTTKPEKADDEDAGEDEDEIEGEDDKAEDETTKESLEVLMKAEKSLSEGFRSKATELFESAVNAKVAAEISKIEESFAARLDEEVATATKDLAEKVDSYLDYVVKTWMEENKVAIEAGLRTEIAENFINSLKSVFVESYIEVPEGKENLVDTLNKEVSKLEEQLLKATESNMKLNESVNVLLRKQIIAEASSDLASTEAVKLDSLVEDVDFESADTFSKKVQTIKESYFRKPVSTPKKDTAVESAIHDDSQPEVEMTPLIAAVSSAISRTLKS
jgi:hypothetical protein